MDLGIKDRTALVAASANGLGLATAVRLAMEGCKVALCDLNEDALDNAIGQVQKHALSDSHVRAFQVDLRNTESIAGLVNAVTDELGTVSILVTNSGGPPPGPFDSASDEKWISAFELVFLSAVRLIRECIPGMKEQEWGRIINFTSKTLTEPVPNLMLSNGVRLAVGGMAKTLSNEIAEYGVTVNNICPGPTSTDRAIELAGARAEKKGISVDEELAITASKIPVGRLADPDEPAALAAFLASDLARYITGRSILVDGGAVGAL
jgi:3-oxoacyl-[acyl-carrier protein] reductase